MNNDASKKYNYSIIVNHGDSHKFGCSRRCTYCNWQRLKNFGKSLPDITNETFADAKGYITISGGGDPLYGENLDSVMDYIPFVIQQIISKGFKPRIITREVTNLMNICNEHGFKVYLSLSYDEIVLREIRANPEVQKFIKYLARHNRIEMTLVADPGLDLKELVTPIQHIASLQAELMYKFPITIRENLRSIKYLKKDYIHGVLEKLRSILDTPIEVDIRWLPANVCLNDNIYLVGPNKCFNFKTKLLGNEITPNYVEVFNILSNNQHYMVFGSVAKYIAAYNESIDSDESNLPIYLPSYHDIDVFVEEAYIGNLLDRLRALGFNKYKQVSDHKIRVYHPLDVGFSIDVNLIKSIAIAEIIVSEALYNINRVGISNGDIKTYDGFSISDLLTFQARALPHRWDYLNFKRRDKGEAQVLQKLKNSGFKIYDMTLTGRVIQAYYKLQARVKRFFQRRHTKCQRKKASKK